MKKILAILACIAMLISMSAVAEVESVVASSLEEAAAYYMGEVPGFTTPAGFEVHEVVVDDFGLTAFYTSADASFEFSIYDYGTMEGVTRYGMKDGKLVELSASVVDLYEEDGMITSADVYSPKGAIYFYFENMEASAIEAVLACLSV